MSEHEQPLNRRRLLQAGLIGGLAGPLALAGDARAREGEAPAEPRRTSTTATGTIQAENARPGASDWQLTYTRIDPATKYRCPWIEGYVSHASAKAGDDVQLFVSTRP